MVRPGFASVLVCVLASVASAQPTPAPAPSPPPQPPPAAQPLPPEPPPAPVADPAWNAYDDAFAKAAKGDRDAARSRLTELAARWPAHPASEHATALAQRLAEPKRGRGDRIARGELVFWSTVGGVLTGVNLCVIADCSSNREYAAVYSAAIGGSLALSVAASYRGVEQGEAQLYNAAQVWGSWTALGINDGFASTKDEAVVALLGQGGGVLLGIGLWQVWRPTQGDVALTNSFLLWGSVLGGLGIVAATDDLSLPQVVVAGDIAIVIGGLVSTEVKMSRGRTLLIDVGGVLGLLAGALLASESDDDQTATGTMFATTAIGLGIASLATRGWDAPKAPPVALAPTRMTQPGGPSAWGITAMLGF